METKLAVLCTISAIFGLLSGLLGFAAEGTKVEGSQIIPDDENNVCVHPDSPASGLGVTSVLALLVALIMIIIAGGCFCCNRRRREYPPSTSCLPLVFFIFSWITFVPAVLLMLGGSYISTKANMDTLYKSYNSVDNTFYSYCYYVKPGIFAVGACLSLISVGLGISYTLSLASTSEKSGGGGIAMGQAQLPPTTQQSGFMYA